MSLPGDFALVEPFILKMTSLLLSVTLMFRCSPWAPPHGFCWTVGDPFSDLGVQVLNLGVQGEGTDALGSLTHLVVEIRARDDMEQLQRGYCFVSTDAATRFNAENLHAERYLNWKMANVSPKWNLTFSRRGT
jgi:hypothetical protein